MSGTMSHRKISEMIKHIDQGRYKLPAFQREYVWKAKQIYALFDSLMLSYPIGTMLSWNVEEKFFKRFEFFNFLTSYEDNNGYGLKYNPKGGDDIENFLDGQQRLTSLYIGLKGTYNGKKLYILILNASSSSKYKEDDSTDDGAVFDSSELANKYTFQFKDDKGDTFKDNDGLWLKVEVVLGLKGIKDTYKIIEGLHLSDGNQSKEALITIEKLREAVNETDRHIYVIDAQSTPEEAMVIFIRSNNTGKKLNPPTIIESTLIGSGVLKRDELLLLAKSIEKTSSFKLTRKLDFFIKAIFTLLQPNVGYNIAACDNFFIVELKEKWNDIKNCIKKTFEFLNHLQFQAKDLPSFNAVLPILFYNYYFKRGMLSLKDTNDAERIRRWLIVTLLENKFSGNSDETITKTRNVFLDGNWLKFKDIKEFPENELYNVLGLDKLSDSKLAEWLNIQYDDSKGRDWLVLKLLYNPKPDNVNDMHRDHMYAKSAKGLSGDKDALVNSILNLQLLWGSLNSSKNNVDFSVWVQNQESNSNEPRLWRRNHLIPENLTLSLDNFDKYDLKIN